MAVDISSALIAQLLAEARAAHPRECCGLLLGTGDRIEALLPAANVAANPLRRFEIDPAVLIAAHRAERRGGPRIAGCYHSHPDGPAQPSATDAALAAGDGSLWGIVAHGTVGWWRSTPGGFVPLPYAVRGG